MNTNADIEAGVDVSAIRAAVITNSPAPYRDQLYRRLVGCFANLRVYYTEPASSDRNWPIDEGCPTERLGAVVRFGPSFAIQPGVARAVRQADVVYVGGYETVTYVAAMLFGRLTKRRVVLFFDGIAPSRFSRRGVRLWAKRLIVRLPHLCLVNGQVGHDYFENVLGVSPTRVQNQYLVPAVVQSHVEEVEPVDVLFVGRLIERKEVRLLLEALRLAPEISADVVGDGPERSQLEADAAGLNVRFRGEEERTKIDARMQAAGCLVVPSRDEPWGLVVQEAIHCNLPVVVSDDVGAALDLVIDGANGLRFPVGDATRLVGAIRRAMELDPNTLRETNAELERTWSLDAHTRAFLNAAVVGRWATG